MPAWTTPELWPVWCEASWCSASNTTISASGRRRASSRPTASPMIPPPTIPKTGGTRSVPDRRRWKGRRRGHWLIDHERHPVLDAELVAAGGIQAVTDHGQVTAQTREGRPDCGCPSAVSTSPIRTAGTYQRVPEPAVLAGWPIAAWVRL